MRLRRSIAVVAAVVLAFALGYATRRGGEAPRTPAPVAAPQPVLADAVRQVLAERYVKELDPGALASARTVPQLIAQLGDPVHELSHVCGVRRAQGRHGPGVLRHRRARARAGQGAAAHRRRRAALARRPRRAAPAATCCVAVDGLRVRGHIDTALAALQAPHRGALRLVMKRKAGKAHVVAVRRGVVRQPAVLVHDEAKGAVRVIRITRFSHGVAQDVRASRTPRTRRRARSARQPGRPDLRGQATRSTSSSSAAASSPTPARTRSAES